MRILLINPPRSPHNAILDNAPAEAVRFVHRKLIGPPLGLITVAGAVKDHDVTVLDLKGESDLKEGTDPLETVRSYLLKVKPQIVGVTFIASEFPAGMEILDVVKKCDSSIITVVGGLHVTLCPDDFESPLVDIACQGQAAAVFGRIVECLSKNESIEIVPGILIRKNSRLKSTTCFGNRQVFEKFIFPDRSHLKPWLQTYRVGKSSPGPVTYLYTSLGCPFKCTFCSIWPQFGGAFLQRSIDSIIEELKTLDDYAVVRFADANTIVDVNFIDQLFTRIAQEGIHKEYVMDIRVDTAAKNRGLIEKLAKGGLKVVIAGFESFRDDELEMYKKGSGADLIKEAIDVFHSNGIMVRGNYVINPDYTEKDFAALAEFANNHRVSFAGYTILTPMPGTEFYNEVRSEIVDHDLSKYNFFNCVLKTRLPLDKFYRQVGDLWSIREGTETI